MSLRHKKGRKQRRTARREPRPLREHVTYPHASDAVRPDASQSTTVTVFGFGPDGCHEAAIAEVAEIATLRGSWPVIWVDVEGLTDREKIKAIGELFGLHALALEDVVNRHQRAKLEEYTDHDFIIVRMATSAESSDTEQIAMFLGRNFVITFQEGHPGDSLHSVRLRLRQNRGGLRAVGADHLAYAILDAIIDGYFPLLESYGERLEEIEDEILRHPSSAVVVELHRLKRELLTLRRTMWSQREVVHGLLRESSARIGTETRLFLRDVYDHSVRIIELVETFRELASDLMDLYLSSISNRLNEIMRVLTVISTIFIPLTFVVGVYGMNFDPDVSMWNMPELRWPYGYVMIWLVMLAIAAGLYAYFWRKGWLRSSTLVTPEADEDGGSNVERRAPRHDRQSGERDS